MPMYVYVQTKRVSQPVDGGLMQNYGIHFLPFLSWLMVALPEPLFPSS